MASTIVTAAISTPAGSYPVVANQGDTVDTEFSPIWWQAVPANTPIRYLWVCNTSDSFFLYRQLVIPYATGTFAIRFTDSDGYYLSNQLIPSVFLVGDPGCPFSLEPGILIPPGGRIAIEILDTSGATNYVQLQFRGVKRFHLTGNIKAVPMGPNDRFIPMPYCYLFPLPQITVASGMLTNQSLRLDRDADFLAQSLQFTSTGPFQVQLKNSSDRLLDGGANQYTPSAALLGTPSIPSFISPPLVTPMSGQLVVNVQDTSGAPNTITLLFKGIKNYPVVVQ